MKSDREIIEKELEYLISEREKIAIMIEQLEGDLNQLDRDEENKAFERSRI